MSWRSYNHYLREAASETKDDLPSNLALEPTARMQRREFALRLSADVRRLISTQGDDETTISRIRHVDRRAVRFRTSYVAK